MMKIEMEFNIPDLESFTFTDSFEKIAKYLEISLQMNFQDGGRPAKWEPKKKDGSPSHLFMTGALFNSIGSESGIDYAEAGAMRLLPYSFIHQYGFDGVRKDGKYMRMPIREYILFQDEDIDFCLQTMGDDLLSFWNSKGEQIN